MIGSARPREAPHQGTIPIVASMTISDFTELATRLYFWADLQGPPRTGLDGGWLLSPGADADLRARDAGG